jgi:hypothetical protein
VEYVNIHGQQKAMEESSHIAGKIFDLPFRNEYRFFLISALVVKQMKVLDPYGKFNLV